MTSNAVTYIRSASNRTIYAVKEGWISKKGSKSFHSFRRRYIILWSNKRIEYYTDDTLAELKGTISLHNLHRRFIQRSDKIIKKTKSMHGFKIVTKKRVWYFCVEDSQSRDAWIQNIRDTIDEKTRPKPKITHRKSKHPNATKAAPSLLASKIHNIKCHQKEKWNQLMAEERIKAIYGTKPCRKSKNTYDSNSDTPQGENTGIASETEQKQVHTSISSESNSNDKRFGELCTVYDDSEGSILGFSLSTTPIINAPASINIMEQMSTLRVSHTQLTDFWNLNANNCIDLSDNVLNAIYCSKHKCSDWMPCFGTKIVENGGRKQWRIKICSRDNGHYIGHTANVVIGVTDIDIVHERDIHYGGFWSNACFGYAFAGYSGNKLHDQISEIYGNKYAVGDVITVSLDLDQRSLVFMCNHKNYRVAFEVDEKRRYVLAVALCSNMYDLQICECE